MELSDFIQENPRATVLDVYRDESITVDGKTIDELFAEDHGIPRDYTVYLRISNYDADIAKELYPSYACAQKVFGRLPKIAATPLFGMYGQALLELGFQPPRSKKVSK